MAKVPRVPPEPLCECNQPWDSAACKQAHRLEELKIAGAALSVPLLFAVAWLVSALVR